MVEAMAVYPRTAWKLLAAVSCGLRPLARVFRLRMGFLHAMFKLSRLLVSDLSFVLGHGSILAKLANGAVRAVASAASRVISRLSFDDGVRSRAVLKLRHPLSALTLARASFSYATTVTG